MTDDELERRLRRFRPAGPPGALRARTLAAARHRGPSDTLVGWWIAAAGVATVCVLALLSALPEQQRLKDALAGVEVSRQVEDAIKAVDPQVRDRVVIALITSDPPQDMSREAVSRKIGERRW